MKNIIKALLVVAIVSSAAGCSAVSNFNQRGQALYDANPAKYDSMSTSDKGNEYFKANPQFNVQGS